MATYIKTIFTEQMLQEVLTAPESQMEKIIRLNPHLSQKQMAESLRRNCDITMSTASYNLSTKIGVLWTYHKRLSVEQIKKAIARIAVTLPYLDVSPQNARKLKALCKVAGVPPVRV